jgi:hypothetical protein
MDQNNTFGLSKKADKIIKKISILGITILFILTVIAAIVNSQRIIKDLLIIFGGVFSFIIIICCLVSIICFVADIIFHFS